MEISNSKSIKISKIQRLINDLIIKDMQTADKIIVKHSTPLRQLTNQAPNPLSSIVYSAGTTSLIRGSTKSQSLLIKKRLKNRKIYMKSEGRIRNEKEKTNPFIKIILTIEDLEAKVNNLKINEPS